MSPDSTILAAVGDETRAYFYDVTRDFNATTLIESGDKLTGWNWELIRCIEMDIGTRFDDGCCFCIAFSQFSRLCAIGSQSGVITIFDVKTIRDIFCEPNGKNSPWDLLVWLEERGRAGIADVRQAFVRRQILQLDMDEPGIQEVRTEPLLDDSAVLGFDLNSRFSLESRQEVDAAQRAILDSIEGPSTDPRAGTSDNSPLRDSLIHNLTERERLIVEFLNTARWTSRLEEGLAERRVRSNANPPPVPRSRFQSSTDAPNRTSRPTSPLRHNELSRDLPREAQPATESSNRRQNAGRQSSVVLSQGNSEAGNRTPESGSSNMDPQPSIALTWTASPAEMQSTISDNRQRSRDSSAAGDPSSSSSETNAVDQPQGGFGRPSANFDYPTTTTGSATRQRTHQRSHSRNRGPERQESTSEIRHEPFRLSNTELRTNVAAERLRRQRQMINDARNRNSQGERFRQQLPGYDQPRSSRWMHSILDELPDRSLGVGYRDQDTGSTAGVGWGADGRTLYIATVDGIFEYQLNVRDRKTFPIVSYR
ncbi:hypothetical protein EYZ11_003279 [Aspergillus tanneri]|uniref:DUF2415 domain-containing protein n=1 Tax=Aspergillus tanneri TaxID=1220188 RepID=A0A4S3JNL2_9EURO|nr:hypothetical protein EYZ11_003279 [Aspergillus tanneri]